MALVDQIVGAESGGNPNARNPRSSATGAGQFISATWLDMLKRHRPDLTTGRSDEEILALRNDPALSREMTQAYATENAKKLESAGLPVTAGTSYLAHFAGPQGAISVLGADPSAPVGGILGQRVVEANPFLAKMTAGDLKNWADKKMGLTVQPSPPSQIPPSVTPIVPQQKPMSIPGMPMMGAPASSPAPVPAEQMQPLPPIIAPPRKPIDLSGLRVALQASGNRGLFLRG